MSTRILLTSARLDDAEAMDQVLARISPIATILPRCCTTESPCPRGPTTTTLGSRASLPATAAVVKCFAVTDITIDQAEMIAAACIDISAWDEALFRETVAQSLGPTIDSAE